MNKSLTDQSVLKMSAPPSQYLYKVVTSMVLNVYTINNSGTVLVEGYAGALEYKSDITYHTVKGYSKTLKSQAILENGWVQFIQANSYLDVRSEFVKMLRDGIGVSLMARPTGTNLNNSAFDLVGSSHVPYAEVTFLDNDAFYYISTVSPTTGAYVPKYADNTFTWGTTQNGYCVGDVSITSSKFRWKTSASGTVTEVDCGTDLSCTIPANTFSTDTVMWQAVITDSTGNTSTSEWQTLTTAEVTPDTAVIVAPKNTMEDGSQTITLRWQHVITTGTPQGAAEVQRSVNGSSWTSLVTITGANQYADISAGTFPAGQNYWRVRTANTDGTYGAWSEAASFLVVSAPPTPNVTTDGKARPTVSWQSSDQQGYRVKIDDLYDSGVMYGTATSFVVPVYLQNGSHVASVSVVNQYGLWSEYGTAPFNVTAAPTGNVVLTAINGDAVQLSWTATTYADGMFLVYRDGKQIAVTSETTYTDNLTAGTHVYRVRQYRTTDNNATSLSNEATATAHVDTLTIIDTETGEQMLLPYSSMQYRDEMETKSMDMTLFHFSGAEYPVPEKSSFENKAISFRTAFMDLAEAALFELFYKRTVCIKTPKDNVVIGVFSAYTKTESRFFVGYDFTIQQIHFSEVVDL